MCFFYISICLSLKNICVSCFYRHLNDWGLGNVEQFLYGIESKAMKREDRLVWTDLRNDTS